jgi:predicted nucleic acid-binding Zn ribbon protein
MERAARLLRQSKLVSRCVTEEDLAKAAWPAAVGKRLAARTRASHMVRGRLVIEVEDEIWRRQLYTLREQMLRNLRKILGTGLVESLEFRVGIPRIPPRADSVQAGAGPLFADEADRIEDPVLRLLYKESRRKSTA